MNNFLQIKYLSSETSGDAALWHKFTEGDTAAYESIYQKYVNELYKYVYMIVRNKPLAEDVIHDVFTDLWSNRARLAKVRSVRLYLFSSIKRRALRKLKKENTFVCSDNAQDDASFEIAPSFLDELKGVQQRDSLAEKIKECVASLSNRQREIIYLRFYQDMPYSDIAELLQLDQKYTYNLASKAFILLRKSIPRFTLLIIYFS